MNFVDGNMTNLISNLELNTLEALKKNGLILSYEKMEGLEGIKYEIKRPDKKRTEPSKTTHEKGTKGEDVGIGKKGWGVRKTKTDINLSNH